MPAFLRLPSLSFSELTRVFSRHTLLLSWLLCSLLYVVMLEEPLLWGQSIIEPESPHKEKCMYNFYMK